MTKKILKIDIASHEQKNIDLFNRIKTSGTPLKDVYSEAVNRIKDGYKFKEENERESMQYAARISTDLYDFLDQKSRDLGRTKKSLLLEILNSMY